MPFDVNKAHVTGGWNCYNSKCNLWFERPNVRAELNLCPRCGQGTVRYIAAWDKPAPVQIERSAPAVRSHGRMPSQAPRVLEIPTQDEAEELACRQAWEGLAL